MSVITKRKGLAERAWEEIAEKSAIGEVIVDVIKRVLQDKGFEIDEDSYETYVTVFQTFTEVYDAVVEIVEPLLPKMGRWSRLTGFLGKASGILGKAYGVFRVAGSWVKRIGGKVKGWFKRLVSK